nr:C-type lectin domain family 17, member A [Cavia porcellus]
MPPAAMHGLYRNTQRPGLSGSTKEEEEEEDGDDYENTAPPYKDLPPKPGSVAPPRPPKAGRTAEQPPLPRKPEKTAALGLPSVPAPARPLGERWKTPQLQERGASLGRRGPSAAPGRSSTLLPQGVAHPEPPTPSPPTPAAPWTGRQLGGCECPRKQRLLCLLLAGTALLLCCVSLNVVALLKCQEVVEALRTTTEKQRAWQEWVTGMEGLAGLKKEIDHVRADTNQSLMELQGLLECSKVTCPDDWLPFEGRCYYFSPNTRSWDDARRFCQENYSHLVIIDSPAEHDFVAKAHGSPRVYWLGLSDKDREGDWRWLDGSPVTLRMTSLDPRAQFRPLPLSATRRQEAEVRGRPRP